jgi:hypothetical protein
MGVNAAAQGGECQIDVFDITSNYSGKSVDIREGVISLAIYESLLDSTVRVNVAYIDTGYGGGKALSESGFNNSVGEKTELVVRQFLDGKIIKLIFKGDYQLRTSNNSREAMNGGSTTMTSVNTWFYSKESMDNHLIDKRVVKKYERKISDNVFTILKDVLGTKKSIYTDASKNDFNFLGGNEKPFHKVTWLCKRTVPEGIGGQGILAGYLFYEIANDNVRNAGGYYFKSVDILFSQAPVKKFILSNTNEIPNGYDAKIINHVEKTSIDLDDHLVSGSLFKRNLETFEPFKNKYSKDDFDYKAQNLIVNNGGKEFWKIATDINFQNNVTRYSSKMFDTGTLPTGRTWGEQKKESKEINFDMDEILRQSTNRYNQLGTIRLDITIAIDLTLHVGDMIFCDFPEIGDSKTQRPSKNKSGLYMIMDLCHRITDKGSWTGLHLVRDTIYRK